LKKKEKKLKVILFANSNDQSKMKLLLLFLTVCFISNSQSAIINIVPENRNFHNTTFTEQFTLPKSYPKSGIFFLELRGTEKANVTTKEEIIDPLMDIFEFLQDKKPVTAFNLVGENATKPFKGKFIISNRYEVSLESKGDNVFVEMKIKNEDGWKSYNLLPFLIKFFNPKDVDLKFIGKSYTNFQKDDVMSESFNPSVLLHKTKILDKKITKFQRALGNTSFL
jgi:hypothetical protein